MIAIIGAGASGLVASIVLARRGFKVLVFEKNNKIGKKLLATGNGRCNITNKNISLSNYYSSNPKFIKPIIARFSTSTCRDFFEQLGIDMIEGENGRLYPRSLQASSVVNQLVYEAKRLGVEFILNANVKSISKNEKFFSLHVEDDKTYKANKVILAAGSIAMPTLGGSVSGYELAKSFGHKIVSIHPSLVQLVTKEDLKSVAGVKLNAKVKLLVDNEVRLEKEGDFLFTNYGVSGSVILDISRIASHALLYKKDVKVIVDLLPEFSKERLKNILKKRLDYAHQKSVKDWLDGFLNSKLALFLAKKLNLQLASSLNQKSLSKLVYELKNFALHVEDTKGFKSAEVCAGGVDTKEINPNTLESKFAKGLYFCGEVMDVDGDCGGYNLHFAWASGYNVGLSIQKG